MYADNLLGGGLAVDVREKWGLEAVVVLLGHGIGVNSMGE
jgi:hypothetical protein